MFEDEGTCPDVMDLDEDSAMDIPYITICFSYCSSGWSEFTNITHSCEVAGSHQNYDQKIKNLVQESKYLLNRIKTFHPKEKIICEAYEIEGALDQQDYAPWLCQKLGVTFSESLDCT